MPLYYFPSATTEGQTATWAHDPLVDGKCQTVTGCAIHNSTTWPLANAEIRVVTSWLGSELYRVCRHGRLHIDRNYYVGNYVKIAGLERENGYVTWRLPVACSCRECCETAPGSSWSTCYQPAFSPILTRPKNR